MCLHFDSDLKIYIGYMECYYSSIQRPKSTLAIWMLLQPDSDVKNYTGCDYANVTILDSYYSSALCYLGGVRFSQICGRA